MLLANADCKIVEQRRAEDAADALKRAHTTATKGLQRCSIRELSAVASINALGKVAINAFTCRLQSPLKIQPEWRILVKRDGIDDEFETYMIRKASKAHHWKLTLEGV